MTRHATLRSLMAALLLTPLLAVTATAGGNDRYGTPVPPPHLPPAASHPAVVEAAGLCMADIKRYCHGIAPGGGRIIRCLAANHEDLHPECRAGIRRARAALGY